MSRVSQPLWGPWECCVSLGFPGPGVWQQALGCIWAQEPGSTSTLQHALPKETSSKTDMSKYTSGHASGSTSLLTLFPFVPPPLTFISGLYVLLKVKLALWRYMRNGSNIPSIFARTVKHHPNKPALIYEATGETWTFTQLDELSNAVAYWARSQGWVSGDVVALFMESRPLQVALWLGLAKVGVEAALINFNLRHDSLLHCIRVSGPRAIVFGAELADGKKIVNKVKADEVNLENCILFFYYLL